MTGVQTCALPIYLAPADRLAGDRAGDLFHLRPASQQGDAGADETLGPVIPMPLIALGWRLQHRPDGVAIKEGKGEGNADRFSSGRADEPEVRLEPLRCRERKVDDAPGTPRATRLENVQRLAAVAQEPRRAKRANEH